MKNSQILLKLFLISLTFILSSQGLISNEKNQIQKTDDLAKVTILPYIDSTKTNNFGYMPGSLSDAIDKSMQNMFEYNRVKGPILNKFIQKNTKDKKEFSDKDIKNISEKFKSDFIIYGYFTYEKDNNKIKKERKDKIIINTFIFLLDGKNFITLQSIKNPIDGTLFEATDKVANFIVDEIKKIALARQQEAEKKSNKLTKKNNSLNNKENKTKKIKIIKTIKNNKVIKNEKKKNKPSTRTFGFKIGLNLADTSLDNDKIMMGGVGGVFLNFQINKIFSIQTELFFSMKGYEFELINDTIAQMYLYYFDIPFLLKINLPAFFFVDFGLYTSFLMNAIYVTEGKQGESLMELYNENDFGTIIGLGLQFGDFSIEARYNHGLKNILKDETLSIENRVLQFMISYTL